MIYQFIFHYIALFHFKIKSHFRSKCNFKGSKSYWKINELFSKPATIFHVIMRLETHSLQEVNQIFMLKMLLFDCWFLVHKSKKGIQNFLFYIRMFTQRACRIFKLYRVVKIIEGDSFKEYSKYLLEFIFYLCVDR